MLLFVGLWIETFTFTEQPKVNYKHEIITVVDVNDRQSLNPSYITWSTYPQYNALHQSSLRVPLVKVSYSECLLLLSFWQSVCCSLHLYMYVYSITQSREEDTNRDGKKDKLMLDIEIPITDSEDVHRITVLSFFEYKLQVQNYQCYMYILSVNLIHDGFMGTWSFL